MSIMHHEGCICAKCMDARADDRKAKNGDPRFEKHRDDNSVQWWPTMSLAFMPVFERGDDRSNPMLAHTNIERVTYKLHQLWESGRGDKEWRQVALLNSASAKFPVVPV